MAVSVKIIGVQKVSRFLNNKKNKIESNIPEGLTKAALHIQNEVKLSIAGRKPEPRSVDTGRFLNSVEKTVQKKDAEVFSQVPYAKVLEFGGRGRQARKHFKNTELREKKTVKNIIQNQVLKL